MNPTLETDRLDLLDLPELSDLLLRHQLISLTVSGWSMYPTLQKGDRLVVEPVPAASLQTGDLVLVQQWDRLLCHRLVDIQRQSEGLRFITKGDAVTSCDPPFDADRILGKVVSVTRSTVRFGGVARRLDWILRRLRTAAIRSLLTLQSRPAYRRVLRRFHPFQADVLIGVTGEGRWIQYRPIGSDQSASTSLPARCVLLAKRGGRPVGSLRLESVQGEYWIRDLVVRIRYRGLGLGSRLVERACALAAACDHQRLWVTVPESNRAARALFHAQGFCYASGTAGGSEPVLLRKLR